VGLLCHGILENLDYNQPGNLDHLLRVEKGKYSRNFSRRQIDRAASASADVLRGFIDSDAARWLRGVEIVGREIPIVYIDPESRRILSGKIDLLVKEGNDYCIIDYKTDQHLPESMLKRYGEQMRLYRQALAESIACPVTAIASKLLLIRTGERIDV